VGNQIAREKPGLIDSEGAASPAAPILRCTARRAPEAPRVRPYREEPRFIEGLSKKRKVAASMKAVSFLPRRSNRGL
jgi:hypothetical protein